MNEEEIIKNIKEMIQWSDHNTYKIALRGILDLYEQEKARNKDLEQIEKEHKEENGRLREKLEKLSKLLYLCTPEIPQCQHGKYISYVDLVKKLEKKDKIINLMAENIADSSNVYENLVNTEFQHTKEEVIEYFTNKVEEDK